MLRAAYSFSCNLRVTKIPHRQAAIEAGIACVLTALDFIKIVAKFMEPRVTPEYRSSALVSRARLKEEIYNFVVALHGLSLAQSPEHGQSSDALCQLFESSSAAVKAALRVDVVQLYYGTTLLFALRATLKAIWHYSQNDLYPCHEMIGLDRSFERGWDSALYQPMLYALGASEITFDEYHGALKAAPAFSDTHRLVAQCEELAELNPLPRNAFDLEHLSHYFSLLYPSSTGDNATDLSRRIWRQHSSLDSRWLSGFRVLF
ncbi:hypothetical protein ACLMJK_009451 [Lecanora helva]